MAATATLTIRTDSLLKQQSAELFGTDTDTGMQEPFPRYVNIDWTI